MRGGSGGVLMGLANLVPGISGGTMLVAAGIYTRFINAIADITTLKFKRQSIIVILSVAIPAAVAVVALAGPIKTLVVDHRWIMYSLFIGLTLGGVPVVWKMINGATTGVLAGAAFGFAIMAGLAWVQHYGGSGGEASDQSRGFILLFLAGVAGASAMILPGVSGAYLLLVLGVYVQILGAVDTLKDAVKAWLKDNGSFDAIMEPTIGVVLPVGVGVVIGIAVVSNLLKWLLAKYEKPTLGVLIGLLIGAVVGLWPFQQAVALDQVKVVKGQVVMIEASKLVYVESKKAVKPKDYPMELATPTTVQLGGAIGLIMGGFATTMLIARFGGEKKKTDEE